ncbi:tape measure protein [Psychrobacter sp. DAB_AL43B]|uniref:tape measure protein n=1 Tax=Psychrobacter sp. DAB_AL43B TaxID=1028416 RepID=UPI0009A63226|nr:tape measure protein [Psychrobacter sp. DAB_AL43B]SLJ84512.1 phage tape measure protein [Psychrobacter sp. DAB_AL43B]
MAGDLDFSVQLRLLNDQFNNGINEARDKFTQYAQSVQRNVQQMNTDTERATTMLAGLGNVSSDRLTAEIRATADQLRQMGAGANLSGEQVEAAMQASALQVTRLGRQLDVARQEAVRLSQTGASPQEVEQATANVNRLEQELGQARSASVSLANELSGAMNRASNTADNARNSIYRITNIRVPETIRGEIDQISRSLVDFQNNSGRPAAEIDRVTRAAQEQIRRLEQELRGADDTLNRTERSTNNLGGGVNKLRSAFGSLQGLLAAAGLGIGVSEIIAVSDAFISLEAKIKLATGEGANFVNGFNGVKQIAADTFSSVENTGELFARITQASEALGLAQKDVLSITQTINQAIKLSGGSAASADAAITQLIQGLQSGVVRGDEFNSIMEQSPRLALAMADGLGVTRGELRAMAMDGKLTSETVINAVRSQGEAIASEFTTLPETVGNAVQTMKNSLFVFIGGMNESVNQSGRLAEAINYISSAFDNIDPTTMATIEKTFDSILTTAGALFTTIKDLYTSLSDIGSAFGVFVKGGEQVGFLTSVMQSLNFSLGVVSDGLKGISILADSMFGTILILAGGVVSTIEKMKGQSSELSDELFRQATELHERADAKVMEFESSTKSAWAEMSKTAKDRLNETLADTEKTYDEMVAKGGHSAEAMEEQYIKVAMAKIAANNMMITDDLRLGLAAQDLQASISETGEVIIESSKGARAAYDGLGQSFAEIALKAVETGSTMQEALADAVPKAQTIGAVDDIINSLSALSSQGKITGEELASGINMANERYKEIEENFARYAAKSIADNDGIVTSELEKAAALQGLAVQATETGNVLVTQLDRSTIASTRTKEQIDELAGSVGVGLSKEFVKSSEGLKELIDGFDDLKDAGYDAGDALVGTLTNMTNKASNTAELDYVIEQWHMLGKEGKLTGQELADGLDLSRTKLDELTDGINSVAEAYGVLGLKTREELAKQAGAFTEAFDIVKKDGQATAQQMEEVFEKTAKANIAANKGVIDAVSRRMAAERGVTIAVDEQGRVTFEKMGQATKANDNVTTSVGRIKTAYDGIASSAGVAGQAMVSAANQAASAYDKLQAKIKGVKEAMELKNADETLKNLRVYGTEKAPSEGNQFGSKLSVENFLKSAGLSAERAAEEARKLYAKQGTSDGALNVGKLQGFKDGQVMTAADIEKFKTASVYLAEIASRARDDEARRSKYESSLNKLPDSALQAVGNLSRQPNFDTGNNTTGGKSYNVKFTLGGITANASVPESQAGMFERMMQELQDSKAIAGY